MREAYRVDAVRAAERAAMAVLPDGTLMQRAAFGLAAACTAILRRTPGYVYGAQVTVLAGTGDNGGDALYAGALLARRGARVTAITSGKAHEQGLAALIQAGGRAEQGAVPDTDLIIDGLLGIGGRGGLREPFAGLARQAEDAGATVVAVDLPSGIDADTGAVDGPAISADVTITFGAIKPGLLIDPGASHAGAVHLVDIGLDLTAAEPAARAPQQDDIADLLPQPGAESDKYRRGVLGVLAGGHGVLAGGDRFGGAAVLATGGAIRGGAGMVRVVTSDQAAPAVRQHWPEAVITDYGTEPGRVQAWVAGPGMGTTDEARARLSTVLRADVPVLVDADGLTLLPADIRTRTAPTLITPHAGELGRLLGADPADIEAHRLDYATRAAAELNITVLLKGSTTVIASPGRATVTVNPTGTPWLATAGSGDVLSGLAGSLLAQGLSTHDAATAAAYLHGLAGRLAADGAPISAADIIAALPEAIRTVSSGNLRQ